MMYPTTNKTTNKRFSNVPRFLLFTGGVALACAQAEGGKELEEGEVVATGGQTMKEPAPPSTGGGKVVFGLGGGDGDNNPPGEGGAPPSPSGGMSSTPDPDPNPGECEGDEDCDALPGCHTCGLDTSTFTFVCKEDTVRQECDGVCVDTSKSDEHCGTCGTACPVGSSCASGMCQCAGGGVICDDQCVDLDQDTQNCGMCGKVCDPAAPFCSQGTYSPCANDDETNCGGTCVDTQTNPSHCGACDTVCNAAAGEECIGGKCLSHCLSGWRNDPSAASCLSQTQSDRAICKDVLDCLLAADSSTFNLPSCDPQQGNGWVQFAQPV